MTTWDVAVVGGGPAGLSAALMLSRAGRRVVVLDSGEYRNAAARVMHGYLGYDGVDPEVLRSQGRAELARYGGGVLPVAEVRVIDAKFADNLFYLTCVSRYARSTYGATLPQEVVRARKLILASGVVDVLPQIPGLERLYGRLIFHCPYCDGWEFRNTPLAIVGAGGAEFAGMLRTWSRDRVWFTEGERPKPTAVVAARCPIVTSKVAMFSEHDQQVRIHLEDGQVFTRRAVFLKLAGQKQRSPLAEMFGLQVGYNGVKAEEDGRTSFRGLYVAGDNTRNIQFAIVAAAEGANAAVAVDDELREEDP